LRDWDRRIKKMATRIAAHIALVKRDEVEKRSAFCHLDEQINITGLSVRAVEK
jgi:hypothetical protein